MLSAWQLVFIINWRPFRIIPPFCCNFSRLFFFLCCPFSASVLYGVARWSYEKETSLQGSFACDADIATRGLNCRLHAYRHPTLYLNVCIPRIMNRIKNELAGCSRKTDSHSPSRGSNDMLQRLSVGVRDFEYSVVVSVPSLVSLYLLSRCCLSTHAVNNFASFYEPMWNE